MFRVLATVFAAAALLAAAPAFAEQRDREAEPSKVPQCCERMAAQLREHEARIREAERKAAERAEQKPAYPVEVIQAIAG